MSHNPITYGILRAGEDLELEVTGFGWEADDGGGFRGFTFTPEHDIKGDLVVLTPFEEANIAQRLRESVLLPPGEV